MLSMTIHRLASLTSHPSYAELQEGGEDIKLFIQQVLDEAVPSEETEDEPMEAEAPANGKISHVPNSIDRQKLLFCERFVEFLIDLMSQAPTRRYSHTLLEDRAVLIKCRMSALFKHDQGGACHAFLFLA